jgi:hypothetical protein
MFDKRLLLRRHPRLKTLCAGAVASRFHSIRTDDAAPAIQRWIIYWIIMRIMQGIIIPHQADLSVTYVGLRDAWNTLGCAKITPTRSCLAACSSHRKPRG